MSQFLRELVGKMVMVVTNDGRVLVGALQGFDQKVNLILKDSVERVYGDDGPVEVDPAGTQMVRGDNLSAVAELDEEKEASGDWKKVVSPQLPALRHG